MFFAPFSERERERGILGLNRARVCLISKQVFLFFSLFFLLLFLRSLLFRRQTNDPKPKLLLLRRRRRRRRGVHPRPLPRPEDTALGTGTRRRALSRKKKDKKGPALGIFLWGAARGNKEPHAASFWKFVRRRSLSVAVSTWLPSTCRQPLPPCGSIVLSLTPTSNQTEDQSP